jgi:phosphoserine phosphatase RsbU/P
MSIASAVVWYLADFLCSPSYSSPLVPFWNALVMFGFFAGAALTLSALRVSLEHDNSLARKIQSGLLPKQMPAVPGLDITSTWLPARIVSGDYFDVLKIGNDLVGFCIADVSGHGMHAALLMSNFQAAFRLLASTNTAPKGLCSSLNEFVITNLGPENFITFFYGVLDTTTNFLVYTNAGHNHPMLVRGDCTTIELCEGGIPLGMMGDFIYEEGKVRLVPGDLLVLYTDGMVELTDRSGEMLSRERLRDLLLQHRGVGAFGVRDPIMKAVAKFSPSNLEDDVTLLVLSLVDSTSSVALNPAVDYPATLVRI